MTAHWGFQDPALFEGTAAEKAVFFAKVFREIQSRISIFLALPIERLSRLALQQAIEDVGRSKLAEPQ
jgi:arsenate reductase